MVRSRFLGVGAHVPARVVTNHDLADVLDTSDEWIQQRTGIRERRFVEEDGVGASDLAVPAARQAVERAGLTMGDIDALIVATLSPDHFFPGTACFLQPKLGLTHIPALDVRNQCSGFLYGLSIADAWVRAGVYKHVLLVGAEVHSSGLDMTPRGRDVSALFGDGAGAAVIGPSDDPARGILGISIHADGSGARDLWLDAPASCRQPARLTAEMMERGAHFPQMNGKQVFRWATEKMPEVAQQVLASTGHGIADVDVFVPHQANLRINELVARRMGLPMEKMATTIDRYGNTTAASLPLTLAEAVEDGRAGPGKLVMFAAFGSGYTWGAALARM